MTAHRYLNNLSVEPLIEWVTNQYAHDREEMTCLDGEWMVRNERVAELLGCSRSRLISYKTDGVPFARADEMACHLGLHPMLLWPEEYAQPIDLIGCIHPERRGVARKLMKAGRPYEHLDGPPVRRAG